MSLTKIFVFHLTNEQEYRLITVYINIKENEHKEVGQITYHISYPLTTQFFFFD